MDYGGTLVDENLRKKLAEESVQRLDSGLKSASQGLEPVVSPAYGAGATPRPLPPKVTTAPVAPAAPIAAGKPATPAVAKPAAPAPANPVVPPVVPDPVKPPIANDSLLPKPVEPNVREVRDLSNLGQKMAFEGKATAGGYTPIADNAPKGVASGMPIAVKRSGTTTDYLTPKGTVSLTGGILGVPQRVGGGTVSAPDQGNGGTVEGNVAALNRQIEALRGLREARNPGITTGGGAVVPQAAAPADPFSRPGDSWGDSEKRRNEYQGLLREAANDKGITSRQREAKIAAAQALVTPGIETAKLRQEGQRARDSLAAQLAQNQAASEDRRFGVEMASKDRLYAADAALAGNRLTAEQQAEKNAIEAYKAATERMGVKPPGLESAYLELMNRRALATDPKDIALIDEQLQQIKDYRRADPMATLNQMQGALQ